MVVDDSLYGTDYSSKGELTATGDLGLVSGLTNAKQNITNWLLTEQGMYPSIDEDYGSVLKETLGEDFENPSVDQLIVHIMNALMDNPRVESILDISPYVTVTGELIMNIHVTLVDGSDENFNINLSENEGE